MPTPQESGFSAYVSTVKYDVVNNMDNPTWLNKKPYNDCPYVVLPGFKFNMAIGDCKPDLIFFVFKNGEQFGDKIPLPGLSAYTITIKVYDYNSNLINFGSATSVDQLSGQVTYTFGPLDFIKSGIYFFEVEFKDNSGNIFTLPESNIKNEIIIRD